jgi:hypothetical protein
MSPYTDNRLGKESLRSECIRVLPARRHVSFPPARRSIHAKEHARV